MADYNVTCPRCNRFQVLHHTPVPPHLITPRTAKFMLSRRACVGCKKFFAVMLPLRETPPKVEAVIQEVPRHPLSLFCRYYNDDNLAADPSGGEYI